MQRWHLLLSCPPSLSIKPDHSKREVSEIYGEKINKEKFLKDYLYLTEGTPPKLNRLHPRLLRNVKKYIADTELGHHRDAARGMENNKCSTPFSKGKKKI